MTFLHRLHLIFFASLLLSLPFHGLLDSAPYKEIMQGSAYAKGDNADRPSFYTPFHSFVSAFCSRS
jgi:hypothetical protein